jgi:Glycosyltransferase like family
MIAFGSSMTSPEIYARWAEPGIRRAVEPDSKVFAYQAAGSIARSYNLILEQAGRCDDLEALVLVHQDAEIADPGFCVRLRAVLADPDIGLVGCVGAVGAGSSAWWDGDVKWAASAAYRYGELGGGELSATSWNGGEPTTATVDVDTIHGFAMALAPWTVRNVRFDETLGPLHGHDHDLCDQVRRGDRRVVTADLAVVHHHSLDLVTDPEPWVAAHIRLAEKWEGSPPDADWKQRARRAEAEAAAARLLVSSMQLQRDAQAREHESRLRDITGTRSWQLTAPLRRLAALPPRRRS